MADVGTLELAVGALVGALILVAVVWGPLFAVVIRAERQHKAELAAEPSAIPAEQTGRDRARELLEADMRELSRFVDDPHRIVGPSVSRSDALPILPMPAYLNPLAPAGMQSLGLHMMDHAAVGGEIRI